MAPRTKSKRQKRQRKHKEDINVVKLVTRGKVSGQFSQRSFVKLSPVVRTPLKGIGEGLLEAGHVFLGFIKSGRYILSYTKEVPPTVDSESESDSEEPLMGGYTLYWWEFNLHRKLKLAQQVKLFADGEANYADLNLHVCEWPNDDSSIAIFGFDAPITSTDQLMMRIENNNPGFGWINWYVTISPNPPSKPCSHCSASTTRTGSGGTKCLEHGYALHSKSEDVDSPFPFQPALQLKKDKVILLKDNLMLVACAIYPCPAGEQSQSCQLLYTKRAGQPSSSPSTLLQHFQQGTPASYSSSSPTLPTSSSQDANQGEPNWIHGYADYRRLYYHPQQGTKEYDFVHFLSATDLKGRDHKLLPGGPCDGQSLCVEEMCLHVGRLLQVLLHDYYAVWEARDDAKLDFVILDVSPQTDNVLIGIFLLWKCEERNMTVSWDLGTGLCNVLGVSDLTHDACFEGRLSGNYDRSRSYMQSLVDTVMEHSVPESSSHRVNVIDDLPKRVLADPERCTWVTTR